MRCKRDCTRPAPAPALLALAALAGAAICGCATSTVIARLGIDAPTYDTEPDAAATAAYRLATDAQIEAFVTSLPGELKAKMHHDPRLDVAAEFVARWEEEHDDEALPETLWEWALARVGVTGRAISHWSTWRQWSSPEKGLTAQLKKVAMELDAKTKAPRLSFGIARFKSGTYRFYQAYIVIEDLVNVSRLRRSYTAGEPIRVRGRFEVRQKDASYAVETDGGARLVDSPFPVTADGSFDFSIPPLGKVGRYDLKLYANVDRSPEEHDVHSARVLNAPIRIEVPDLSAIEATKGPIHRIRTLSEWPDKVLEILNAQRARRDLPPLVRDPRADKAAAATVEKLAAPPSANLETLPGFDSLAAQGLQSSRNLMFAQSFGCTPAHCSDVSLDWLVKDDWGLDDRATGMGGATTKYEFGEGVMGIGATYLFNDLDAANVHAERAIAMFATGSDAYSYDEPLPTPGNGLAEDLARRLAADGGVPVRHSARLDALARAYAEFGDLDVRQELRRWMVRRLGWTGSRIALQRRRVKAGDDRVPFAAAEIRGSVERYAGIRGGSYSLGAARVVDGEFAVEIVAVQVDEIALEPLPKAHAPGAAMTIAGRFFRVPPSAALFVDRGDTVERIPFTLAADGRFTFTTAAPTALGEHMIEIAVPAAPADDLDGPSDRELRTVILAPIWVGTAEPARPDPAIVGPRPFGADETSWAELALRLLNEARAERGIPPLQRDRLADVVLGDAVHRADESIDPPTLDHLRGVISRAGGRQALARHDFDTPLLEDSIRELLRIPSWRAEILSPRTTALGFYRQPAGYRVSILLLADGPAGAAAPIASLDVDPLVQLATANIKDIGKCLKPFTVRNKTTNYRIDIELALRPNGSVVGIAVNAGLNEWWNSGGYCIADAIGKWKFPATGAAGVGLAKLGFGLENKDGERVIRIY